MGCCLRKIDPVPECDSRLPAVGDVLHRHLTYLEAVYTEQGRLLQEILHIKRQLRELKVWMAETSRESQTSVKRECAVLQQKLDTLTEVPRYNSETSLWDSDSV